MNAKIKRALEVTRLPRFTQPRGIDEVCKRLTAITMGKKGLEAQLSNCKERMRAIGEVLSKIYKEESYLLDCLKQGKMPERPPIFDNGNGNEQHTAPETPKKEGKKELVFRF